MTSLIPYGRQCIEQDDIDAVADVLKSDFLTTGPMVGRFEAALREYTGCRHVVCCSSGTMALYLAYRALKTWKVSTTTNTFIATATAAVAANGANVCFHDIDPLTYNAQYSKHPGESDPDTCALVDFAGLVADADEFRGRYKTIVRDACHSLGVTTYDADVTVHSFHPVKAITSGEGGCLVTDNEYIAEQARYIRNHGRYGPIAWYRGVNGRMSDIHAALGLSQLGKLDRFIARRREIARHYRQEFHRVVQYQQGFNKAAHACHLFVILVEDRDRFRSKLEALGVGTQVHYRPVHLEPIFGGQVGDCPNAEYYSQHCLSLPIYPAMTDEQVEHVIASVKEVTDELD